MKRVNWRLLLILLIFGGGLIFMTGKDFITSLQKPVDLNELEASEIKPGMHIKTDIFAALDAFASEETWTENKNGSTSPKKTSNQYYIIPVGVESVQYMGLEVRAADFSTMDTIMDNTYAWVIGEAEDLGDTSYTVEGTIEKLEGELDQYFGEWFTDTGFLGEDDPGPYLVHYMLVTRSFKNVQVMFGLGVLLLVLAGLYVFLRIRKNNKAADTALAADGAAADPAAPVPAAAPKARTDDEYENANKTDRGMN